MITVPYLEKVFVSWFRPVAFDDTIDRLNYFYTASLICFFALVVSAKQYVGAPIQCWMPTEFKGGWEQYAEDYCFIQNTFFVPFNEEIPSDDAMRSKAEIGYYQWVPIVLALQAIMFYLPNWLWTTLHRLSGLDLGTAMSDAEKMRGTTGDARKKDLEKLSLYLEECLEFKEQQRTPLRIFCFRIGRGLGSYMSLLYLVVKSLYLLNIVIQFYILNRFLGSNYSFWGIQTFIDLYSGREWMDSGVFPRVTLCDFKVRRLGNIHRYTVQCVLMINMFNEKIFLFLWFWFLFVAVTTAINFFYSSLHMTLALMREKSTRQWLKRIIGESDDNAENYRHVQGVKRFCHQALRSDGVLALRFIESHAGSIIVRELATKLYTDFLELQAAQSSTKTTSPGILNDDGQHESLYVPTKPHGGLMMPDYPTKVALQA